MKFNELINDLNFNDFIEQYFNEKNIYKGHNEKIKSLITRELLEDYIKEPTNFKNIQKVRSGVYSPFIAHTESKEEYYNTIKELNGDDFWRKITKNECTIHISGFLNNFPELKELSLDIYKKFKYGCQSYIVASYGVKESCYKHHADPMDLFALQVIGNKEWNIPYNGSRPDIAYGENLSYDPDNCDDIEFKKIILSPGDFAFIPFRAPHYVEAKTDKLCVHFVVGNTRYFYGDIKKEILGNISKKLSDIDHFQNYEIDDESLDRILEDIERNLNKFLKEFDKAKLKKMLIDKQLDYDLKRSLKG